METDYISRKAAIEAISEECKVCEPSGNCPFIMNCLIKQKRKALNAVPPAEVRPVVLCRDCVHFTAYSAINDDGTGMCGLCGKLPIVFMVDENDFCSSGKRREDGRIK